MQVTIEIVKSGELNTLLDISRKTFYDTFYMHNTKEDMNLFLEQHLNETALQEQLLAKENFFFFAKAGDEVAGFLKLAEGKKPDQLGSANALEIARIYALQEKVGSGIGKAMMTHAVAFAKDRNKQVLWLGVWEHNQKAIDFYRRFGFEKFGEHTFMLGNDAQTDWLMKKQL